MSRVRQVRQKGLEVLAQARERYVQRGREPSAAVARAHARCCAARSPGAHEHWEVDAPGYVEVDAVVHCGESMVEGGGDRCLTMTNVHIQRTDPRAVM